MRTIATAKILIIAMVTLSNASCSDDDPNGDGAEETDCAVLSDACLDGCIIPECGQSHAACEADTTCAEAKSTLVACVCDAQLAGDDGAVDECQTTFVDNGGDAASALASCRTANCATPCGL